MGYNLNTRERYSAARDQAADRAFLKFQTNQVAFAQAISATCFLTDAFLSPAKTREKLTYLLDRTRVENAVQMQTQAAIALHRMWLAFKAGKAQTQEERALAGYLDSIVQSEIDSAASDEAEAEVESRR